MPTVFIMLAITPPVVDYAAAITRQARYAVSRERYVRY